MQQAANAKRTNKLTLIVIVRGVPFAKWTQMFGRYEMELQKLIGHKILDARTGQKIIEIVCAHWFHIS